MNGEIAAQLHFWPWSVGVPAETKDLTGGAVEFPFRGSPVISVSTAVTLFLSQRYEPFVPFGPCFRTPGDTYQLYEMPHGVMAARRQQHQAGGIVFALQGERKEVSFTAQGARTQYDTRADGKIGDFSLYSTILAWSRFFDECREKTHGTNREGQLAWASALELIQKAAGEGKEPRMALIVDIARKMQRSIGFTVAAARKILLRERRLLPVGRIEETDTACLKWYVRQPGETMAQKAASNRQCLFGVARRESFNTLENQVLKDFLLRCRKEAERYLAVEVGPDCAMQDSTKAKDTKVYAQHCAQLSKAPQFSDVTLPHYGVHPNYVLQNDLRYRDVWKNYLRLLRQEDEQDRMWDWQSRTWADVARLLVNAALFQMGDEKKEYQPGKLFLRQLLTSAVHVSLEQQLGSRIEPGSEPGPFEVHFERGSRVRRYVLEVVHSQEAGEHPVAAGLGRLGGHLYLVLTPLGGGRRTVIVMWAVHTAGVALEALPPGRTIWETMMSSAFQALRRHSGFLEERNPNFPSLQAFIVASDLMSRDAELHGGGRDEVPLLQVGADNHCWDDALSGISGMLAQLFEAAL